MLIGTLQEDAQRTAFVALHQAVIALPLVDKLVNGDLTLRT